MSQPEKYEAALRLAEKSYKPGYLVRDPKDNAVMHFKKQMNYTLNNYKQELEKLKTHPKYCHLFVDGLKPDTGLRLSRIVDLEDMASFGALIEYATRLISMVLAFVVKKQEIKDPNIVAHELYRSHCEEGGFFNESCSALLLCVPMTFIVYENGTFDRPEEWQDVMARLFMVPVESSVFTMFLQAFNKGLITHCQKSGLDEMMYKTKKYFEAYRADLTRPEKSRDTTWKIENMFWTGHPNNGPKVISH